MTLDKDNKVLYSVGSSTFASSGKHGGLGYPEILCDSAHCSVLLPFLDAAMRKVKKTSADREEVKPVFLRLVRFCQLMVAATAPAGTAPLGSSSAFDLGQDIPDAEDTMR